MGKNRKLQEEMFKNIMVISGVSFCVLLIILGSIIFIKNKISSNKISEEEILGEVEENSQNNLESASTEIGKTVEEAKEEIDNDISTNTSNVTESNKNSTSNTTTSNKEKTTNEVNQNNVVNTKKQETSKENKTDEKENKTEESKQIKFTAPVKGEILREFASDSLVYSETLQEWITHKGVDIKADKTTVVVASCEGTVQSIKNDPRYGLTVIINHEGGYQTVYSNLLTAEFVVEGEKVTEGQTIGTVGNTSSFEVNDPYHLHFELLKDNEYQDPTIYMEF